jgi:hypothetical protein
MVPSKVLSVGLSGGEYPNIVVEGKGWIWFTPKDARRVGLLLVQYAAVAEGRELADWQAVQDALAGREQEAGCYRSSDAEERKRRDGRERKETNG